MIEELHITCPDGRVIVLDLTTGERTIIWHTAGLSGEGILVSVEEHDHADCDCDECRADRQRMSNG